MPHDFGPYGKNYSGYSHYIQPMEESKKGRGGKLPSGSGCLTLLVAPFTFISSSTGKIIKII